MTDNRRGDRASGAVSPMLLVVGGLVAAVVLVVVVAASGLLGFTRDDGSTQESAPSVSAPPTTSDDVTVTTEPVTVTTEPTSSAEDAAPEWIRIEAGDVDGPLVPQGLASDGTINPGRDEIIWFTGNDRVEPGEVGTSVIAAHVTWEGEPDAFINLPEVAVGDEITVGYDDGTTTSFTVTDTAAVDKEALARSVTVWGDHPDVPRLAIITCDPVLGYGADGHTQANFVVIAEEA